MGSRVDLQYKLEEILEKPNVYFQPPSSVKLRYRAIVYNLKDIAELHADDLAYQQHRAYELTLIDENPDSEYVAKILQLRYCSFDRFFTSDNLNHWVFTLYW